MSKYTKDELINFMIDHYERKGHITYRSFQNDPKTPSSGTVDNYFGRFSKGKEQAGLTGKTRRGKVIITEEIKKSSSEKSYINGVLLGDGCIWETDEGVYHMGLGATDIEFVEEFGETFCNWTNLNWDGFKSSRTQMHCRIEHYETSEGETKDLYKVSKGINSIVKHIDEIINRDVDDIVNLYSDFSAEMVKGLWDSEGYISKEGRVGMGTTEKRLAFLYMKLLSRTIDIDFSENKKEDNNKTNTYGEFKWIDKESDLVNRGIEIRIPNKYRDEFFRKVNPTIQRKRDRFA